MPPRLELAGRKFGRLIVISRSHQDRFQAWIWSCDCECGRRVQVRGSTLTGGRTKACISCAATESGITHGQSRTPLYCRWRAMHERVGNPNATHYHNYGGRGITICDRWRSYENFAADMGPSFSTQLELDRIDVNGPYSPENCRWATIAQQARNKRTNHVVTWRGRTLVVTDWALLLGIKPNTLIYRLRRGWSLDRALTTGANQQALHDLNNSNDTETR